MLEIHEIAEADIPAIECLEQNIFPDPWSRRGLLDTWSQDHARILGTWQEGTLVGYLIFYYVLDEGEIARIAVDESRRRGGVAGRMLKVLFEWCVQNGITKMMLDVRESNLTAINFYRHHGFTEDGIRKGYYGNPTEDAILMSLEIGS